MAKSKSLKVYLDHHIRRENLLYRRTGSGSGPTTRLLETGEVASQPLDTTLYDTHLKISDLHGRNSKVRKLRKPDFQRATWAWSPEECVDLLESVLEERVVPSVIMWLSPENFQYVLDGGHRISVLLGWITDNWGDRLSAEEYSDPIVEENNKEAARAVRELLRQRGIGTFKEYDDAEAEYWRIEDEGKNPRQILDTRTFQYAEKQRRWSAVSVGFPILWVKGDYEVAEQSFLKINKTGRRLSDWETKLVENRSSSFARVVMSISTISAPQHCWPLDDPEVENSSILQKQVEQILEKVRTVHDLLFDPPYRKPISDIRQPLLATPYTKPEMKPAYLAELITIAQGKKGQKPETESLIKKDRNAKAAQVIANGEQVLKDTLDVISNIYGPSPRSLGLLPLLYYYNKQGIYVRSLLYGIIYWLTHGTATEVNNRKFLLTAHRENFESVLYEHKERIIRRIGRKIGSGAEVTLPTARYFNGLLKLLIEYKDTKSIEFDAAHRKLIATLGKEELRDEELDLQEEESSSRTFRGGDRDAVAIRDFIEHSPRCEICHGMYYPNQFTQVDHIEQHTDGGKTKLANARNTHPFCNNRRKDIEDLTNGLISIELPPFDNVDTGRAGEQLSFLAFFEEAEEDPIEAASKIGDTQPAEKQAAGRTEEKD
jgi:hypothetical protein